MTESPKLLSRFELSANDILGELDGIETRIDFRASILTPERDSNELRQRLVSEVLEKCIYEFKPRKLTKRKIQCEFRSAFPAHLAPESEFKFWKSPPSARARVTIIFEYQSNEQFESYAAIEQDLSKAIDKTEIGFVDGNEVGQGTYEIVLFGPKKKPLLDFANNWLAENSITPKKVK